MGFHILLLYSYLLQYTVTIESDTKMVEINKSEMANWIPMSVVREVKDGKICEVCLSIYQRTSDAS